RGHLPTRLELVERHLGANVKARRGRPVLVEVRRERPRGAGSMGGGEPLLRARLAVVGGGSRGPADRQAREDPARDVGDHPGAPDEVAVPDDVGGSDFSHGRPPWERGREPGATVSYIVPQDPARTGRARPGRRWRGLGAPPCPGRVWSRCPRTR